MRKRKKENSENKMYFTQYHQQAIIDYCSKNDKKIRNDLFVNIIEPVFVELISKICHKYKFHTLPNVSHLKNDCLCELTSILGNFDKNKGSTAFSYFSVCTKNFFYRAMKDNAKKQKRDALFDDISQHLQGELDQLQVENPYENERENIEFIQTLSQKMLEWEDEVEKPNEKKILQAIKILLENPYYFDENEMPLNKKSIYLYLRELSKLNTKQVSAHLNKIRKFYITFRKEWDNGDV